MRIIIVSMDIIATAAGGISNTTGGIGLMLLGAGAAPGVEASATATV